MRKSTFEHTLEVPITIDNQTIPLFKITAPSSKCFVSVQQIKGLVIRSYTKIGDMAKQVNSSEQISQIKKVDEAMPASDEEQVLMYSAVLSGLNEQEIVSLCNHLETVLKQSITVKFNNAHTKFTGSNPAWESQVFNALDPSDREAIQAKYIANFIMPSLT